MPAPFLYIAALRRSGSTVLSEALTALPYSFIFREPRLASNHFVLNNADHALFANHNVDLMTLRIQHGLQSLSLTQRIFQPDCFLRFFAGQVIPALRPLAQQLGVKEIEHDHWRRYARFFPDMKVVLIARDPRDIYISVYYRKHAVKRITPKRLARVLNRQFKFQREMINCMPCFRVTYEDLCTNPGILSEILKFAESPLPTVGNIGAFNASNPKRIGEAELHGAVLSAQRVNRWRRETNKNIAREAHELFDRMPAYCEFWQYRI